MIRVYLDWNIISYLRQFGATDEPYRTLARNLENHKGALLIPYTSAHLTDLISGYKESEKAKIETEKDLKYLATVSQHHCIVYDFKQKRTYCDVYDINEYFEQLLDSSNEQFDSLETLLSFPDNPELEALSRSMFELFKLIPTGVEIADLDGMVGTNPLLYQYLAGSLQNGSFYDLFNDTIKMVNDYNNNHKTYRGIRNASLQQLKMTHDYTKEDDPIEAISRHLRSSAFQKTFQEFSEHCLKNFHKESEPSRFDAFTNDYMLLDFLGFYKDKQFRNLVQDSFHACYGAHCDFFVTDDRNTYHKAKVIYERFNIETIVCTSAEFNTKFYGKVVLNAHENRSLPNAIAQVLRTSVVLTSTVDDELNPVSLYKIEHYLLYYFNRLQVTQNADGSQVIYLFKRTKNYSEFTFWTEIETLTRKLVEQFGPDLNLRSTFNPDVERQEINDGNWKGRNWRIANIPISLYWSKENGMMVELYLKPQP